MVKGISLNYRGDSGFGTILGGCLSLSLSLFIFTFMTLQGIAWAFTPRFNQQLAHTYLHRDEETIYTIPVQSFLPTIGIYSVPKGKMSDPSSWENNNNS